MGAWKTAGGLAGLGGLRGLSSVALGEMAAGLRSLGSMLKGLMGLRHAGASSGGWMQFANDIVEGGSGVIGQIAPNSCVSAVGEMLSLGRVSQADLIKVLTGADGRVDYTRLPQFLGDGWRGKFPLDISDFLGNGPVGIVLKEFMQEGHCVWANAVDGATLQILDPWPVGSGTAYTIAIDSIKDIVSFVIFQQ